MNAVNEIELSRIFGLRVSRDVFSGDQPCLLSSSGPVSRIRTDGQVALSLPPSLHASLPSLSLSLSPVS